MRAGTLVTLVVALASGPATSALAQQDEAATDPEGNDSQNLDDRQSLTSGSGDGTFWDNYWYQPPANGGGFQQPPAGAYQLEQPLAGSYQLEQPLNGTYQLQQPSSARTSSSSPHRHVPAPAAVERDLSTATAAQRDAAAAPPLSGTGAPYRRALKVSHASSVPCSRPRLNQVMRCAAEPWVKDSGTT
ncbi:hypothetical protein [Corallococcus sp. 4LFB]|uniref:hypothetical protein n=1 Tax=Corallococcus sp. 4LFB TaxID=3383249 RepID=UPI003974DC93